ncbi:HAD-superfamily hydrolase [Micromonospora sp. ATCC 39149]|uniref:HAD family hydrolase n=1 Tax=Micromonospora carbonacea TaxID=47853 RepID=A0A7D5YE95_9ACTN|nr:HAD-IA family hydrolase [Micromonospora sp. ATCC 39149]EEP71029.1 HAD-superfamily hydrolase [Micromonospora sp. ATCC 39149]QLJ97356.1 HAD family hydrolase [Micromonospora carbonacea]
MIDRARVILLDFDGPVCGIFARHPASTVAHELRRLLVDQAVTLPPYVLTEHDPLAVLRFTATIGRPAVVRLIDQAMTREEVTAARTAEPTPYGREVIVAAQQTGRRVAVVSNNSAESVRAYLSARRLTAYVHPVIGRPEAAPERMKPDPFSVLAAVRELGAEPAECVLVGDSVSDIEAAHAAGVSAIGYANKPGKRERLAAADAVIDSMAELVTALTVDER